MQRHPATELGRLVKRVEEKTLHPARLNIGSRLILCFVFIILVMLGADAVVLWQFHLVNAQAERLNGIDQQLVTLLRVHTSLLEFYAGLEALAQTEDAALLVKEAGALRTAALNDVQHAVSSVSLLPSDFQRDPNLLPTLHVIQSSLTSQLETIIKLATSGDWRAVRLRLSNQVRPLESLTSSLVEKVDHDATEQRAETVLNSGRVQRLVFVIVPTTAVFALLIAATLGLAITRSITQPLAGLVEGSKALARGEFQHQVTIQGEDELAHLGQVFNDTARRLRDLYAVLQSSEDRLRLVIDTIPAQVWSTAPDGSVDFINRRWLESTGLSAETTVGWNWSSAVHPDDLTRFVDALHRALAAGEPMESEARLRQADGKYRWFLIRNVPLRDELGNIVNWYGTSIDIEDRKQAEDALRQAQADLAHVNRVNTMGELTASIAHEVNQPLAAVVASGYACLRFLSAQPPSLAKAQEAVESIVRDGTAAGEVVRRIRALFKRAAIEKVKLDLNEVIREVLSLLRGETERRLVIVETDLGKDIAPVMGDRVQLQQLLLNLLLNGIEAMDPVLDRSKKLFIRSKRDGPETVLVEIQDCGVGLKDSEKVFEAFVTTKENGMGMGLAICRSIVEAHNGRLWATSGEGPGATFCFTLPVKLSAES
jgi:PAS domain S-box-containing protein